MIHKVRAQHIMIDLPTEDAALWVRVTLQDVYKDEVSYTTQQIVDRVGYCYREIGQIATNLLQVYDPVTKQTHTMSGAGCAAVVKAFVTQWICQDRNGTVNSHGDIIVGR